MAAKQIFILTKRLYGMLITSRRFDVPEIEKCRRCGLDFVIGDMVASVGSPRKKLYHENCYESMFVET